MLALSSEVDIFEPQTGARMKQLPEDSWSPIQQFWAIQQKLGGGAFGTVCCATNKNDGSRAAVKIADARQLKSLETEAWALNELREAKHVVRMHVYGYRKILLEYCETDLHRYLVTLHSPLLPSEVWRLWRHVLTGLSEMHAKGLVHLDIKPQNILLKKQNGSWTALLADLGSIEKVGDVIAEPKCTIWFRAPELYTLTQRGQVITADTASDIWSAGLILAGLIRAPVSFGGLLRRFNTLELYAASQQLTRDLKDGTFIPGVCAGPLHDCLQLQPQDRASAQKLLENLKKWSTNVESSRPPVPSTLEQDVDAYVKHHLKDGAEDQRNYALSPANRVSEAYELSRLLVQQCERWPQKKNTEMAREEARQYGAFIMGLSQRLIGCINRHDMLQVLETAQKEKRSQIPGLLGRAILVRAQCEEGMPMAFRFFNKLSRSKMNFGKDEENENQSLDTSREQMHVQLAESQNYPLAWDLREILKRTGPSMMDAPAGIMHRLDVSTSGIVCVAETPEAYAWNPFHGDFCHCSKKEKVYVALLYGHLKLNVHDHSLPSNPSMQGKLVEGDVTKKIVYGRNWFWTPEYAHLEYRKIRSYFTPILYGSPDGQPMTLARVEIMQGHRHQIRVCAEKLGHPLVNDLRYMEEDSSKRYKSLHKLGETFYLHHYSFKWEVPQEYKWRLADGAEGQTLHVQAPVPIAWAKVLADFTRASESTMELLCEGEVASSGRGAQLFRSCAPGQIHVQVF